jgi:hypothetical protein
MTLSDYNPRYSTILSTSSLTVEEVLHVDPPSAELIPLADLIFTQQMEPVLPTHDLPDLLTFKWKEKQSTSKYWRLCIQIPTATYYTLQCMPLLISLPSLNTKTASLCGYK